MAHFSFAKSAPCPVCKAPAGAYCRNLEGRCIPPHRVRAKAALQAACAVLRPFKSTTTFEVRGEEQ